MTSLVDWDIGTQNELRYGLSWGDMPEYLYPWDWLISSNTVYNACAVLPEPLTSPSSSGYADSDPFTASMLNDERLYSEPLSGSLFSTYGVQEEANLDILQDCHGTLGLGIKSITNSTPPEAAEAALRTAVSTSIKTCTDTAEANKRSRRKPSKKKNARKTEAGLSREEKRPSIKLLERNRRAAANCRARKQAQQDKLKAEMEKLQERHKELSASCNELRETAYQLKLQLLGHSDCGCALIQRYIANSAEILTSRHSPSGSPNCTTIASATVCESLR